MRSAFSFLEGSSLPEDLVERAAELGHGTLALSDVDGLYGIPRFHGAAKKCGLRAIIGARVTLQGNQQAPVSRRAQRGEAERRRLARGRPQAGTRKAGPPPTGGRINLLVKDRQGYRNLSRLLTLGHRDYEKPYSRVSWDALREHREGLVAIVREPALARPLRDVFGLDAFGELQRHRDPDQERHNRALLATGIAPLATGDVRHARPGGKRLLDALTCLKHKTELDRAGRLLLPNAERHLLPASELARRFRDLPQALTNSLRVAERCEFTLENLGYHFPDFPLGPGETLSGVLRQLSEQGARERCAGKIPR